ncbi:MAG: AarF/ABC1/UbiB kinase family protein [Candidatus Thalassarchaeaceae archaeon]|nr:AarF/ABC1/UbiB kinase family protein [Candidatus Thalassarchaeaceae archaeon]
MRLLTFLRFYREIRKDGPADLDWIQRQGLLAVKLTQIFALRPDMLSIEKCRQLQKMYRNASTIASEDVMRILEERAPESFHESIVWFDEEPLAAASVGQVHRATLATGEDVVVKVVKADHKKSFQRDVKRMMRMMRVAIALSPKLRRVGNPMALLRHVEDYTTRELDLRNEIRGGSELKSIQEKLTDDFPMPRLRFPKYYPDISNEHVLVSEFVEGKTLEECIEDKSLAWDYLIELFRIHGAYMFGVGTFHGDLHPGNCIVDGAGNFVFIDNGAICEAPRSVSLPLFKFFEGLSKNELDSAFDALIGLADDRPSDERLIRFKTRMSEIYSGFGDKSVGEQSLTDLMMRTVRAAVEDAGADFGEEGFPIIRSLMYMDGLVIRTHPEVKLIAEMGPSLVEFREGLGME